MLKLMAPEAVRCRELVVLLPQPRAVLIFVALVTTKADADVLSPEVMLIFMDAGEPALLPLHHHPTTAGELAPPLAVSAVLVEAPTQES